MKNKILISLSVVSYLVSIFFQIIDNYLYYQLICIGLWLFSISTAAIAFGLQDILKIACKHFLELFKKASFINLTILIVLTSSIALRLIYLDTYPFFPAFDALRDTGYNTRFVFDYPMTSLFGYGSYNGYSLHIVLICALNYLIFGPTAYTYTVVATIFSFLTIFTVYIVTLKVANKKTAAASTFILAMMPLHLYYSRTEPLISLTCFWSAILIGLLAWTFRKKTRNSYLLLALISGLSMEFYSGVRGFVVVLLALFTFYILVSEEDWKNKLLCFFGMSCVFLIGLGPQILYMEKNIFFPPHRLPIAAGIDLSNSEKILNYLSSLAEGYLQSFMSYFYENTRGHYSYAPIHQAFTGFMFLSGFFSLFIAQRAWHIIIFLILLIIPFTHSAMTETLVTDQRLSCIYPIAAIVAGIGFVDFIDKIISENFIFKIIKISLLIIFVSENSYRAYDFFVNERIDCYVSSEEKRPARMIRLTASENLLPKGKLKTKKNICIHSSEKSHSLLATIHYRQMAEYFIPGYNFRYISNQNLKDSEIAFSENCDNNLNFKSLNSKTYCEIPIKFICSVKDPTTIYY